MPNYDYDKIFNRFEPQLISELKNFEQIHFPKGSSTCDNEKPESVEMIPLVLSGNIQVFNSDENNKIANIYSIKEGESCIISITAGFRKEAAPVQSRAIEDSDFIAIPANISSKWIEKYPSWRDFVIELYNKRIYELIHQHQKVSEQRDEISLKNTKIFESIRYARRIQSAVLPPSDLITRFVPEHFIFYKPRDIVSGDFYWVKQDTDKIYLAAADATGHGVPGAFMSMLGISLMNQISYQFNGNAADFLNTFREKIKESLRQSEFKDAPKDGIDVSLVILYPKSGKIDFAGAYNPLLIIRNKEIIEIKADKMPIGIHYGEKASFTNQTIEAQENDMFYMYSDGFPDQLGGAQNRKYLRRNFRNYLKSIAPLTTTNQQIQINEEFTKWKGKNEQIDDILVFGFKIKKSLTN